MIQSIGQTHPGYVRSNNEDSLLAIPKLGLYAVADGLGGANAGERASKIAVDTLEAEVRRAGDAATGETLLEAIELANRNIRWEAESDPALAGMGTTVTAALVREDRVVIANVGDSRLYRLSGDSLECLTKDHTWISDVASRSGSGEEAYKNHPYRHMLTKAVGTESVVGADRTEVEFAESDLLLLCSDGLHGVLSEDEIVRGLQTGETLLSRSQALIDATLERGAPDNVTVLLIGRIDAA